VETLREALETLRKLKKLLEKHGSGPCTKRAEKVLRRERV
jgi:hypothetical protein